MKLNEPRQSEIDRWPKKPQNKTKGGIILTEGDYKSYTDYLEASNYRKEYKDFCIRWYNNYKTSDIINNEIDT